MSNPSGGRGRGRARGRAFAPDQSQQPMRRPAQAMQQQPPAQPPPRRPSPPLAAAAAAQPEPPVQQMARMSLAQGDPQSASVGGNGVKGRGAYRGRQDELVIVRTRPQHIADKRGQSGDKVPVVANYFRLLSLPNCCVYQYHVDFSPTVESSKVRRGLLQVHKQRFGSAYLFDGMSDLKSTTKLENEVTELYSQRLTDGENIRITIKRTRELAPTDPELLRLFNTQMRRNMQYLDFNLINRNYFNQKDKIQIPKHGIELWPGTSTAVRQHETNVMLVVDTVHKVMRTDTVLDMLNQIRSNYNDYKQVSFQKLVGSIVLTAYNNRTYRIDDIDWNQSPTCQFDKKGTKISYIEYYKSQYDITIRDGNQPLLVCRPSIRDKRAGRLENIYLVPEVCTMTGLTDEMRSDFNVMKDLAQYTRIDPQKRVQNLNTFIGHITGNAQIQQEMQSWGLRFDNKLVDIEARLVPQEVVFMRDHRCNYDRNTADFSRDMRGHPMHTAMNLHGWFIICTKRDSHLCNDFVQNLMRVCPPMGMQVSRPECIYIPDDRVGTYINAFRDCYRQKPSMVVFIVPNNKRERYDAIKKAACVDMPVHSQVVVARTLSKKQMLMSVATKIGIQLNCKMGGEAWCVEIPLKNLMVIGFDTYHDSRQKGFSAGGMVASLNRTLTRWYSQVAFHSTHQELSDSLMVMFTNAIKKYHSYNKSFPDRIIIYRDGVSEGQIPHVQKWELEQMLASFKKLATDFTPKLGFIIVTKRISTRFFARNGGNGYQNPKPGTVVDSEVTRPEWYDFFLVSQSVRQGTVSPTQYNVIYDTTGLKPEHFQRLTYKLTHLYFNWPGTIRVPAPCQYAHKLAFLVGQNLHVLPDEKLADTLYYL